MASSASPAALEYDSSLDTTLYASFGDSAWVWALPLRLVSVVVAAAASRLKDPPLRRAADGSSGASRALAGGVGLEVEGTVQTPGTDCSCLQSRPELG